jgi:zinc protease
MRKLPLVLLLTLITVPAFTALSADTTPQTADEVVERHLAAMGGREALGKLTSRKGTGSVSVATEAGEFSGTVEVYAKAPNKSRALLTLDLSAFGAPEPMVIDQRFDGTSGIAKNNLQGDMPITGSQLDNMKNNAFPTNLLNYKEQGTTIELLPKEMVGGRELVVLQMTPKVGSVAKLYLDPETWLLVQSTAKVSSPETGELEQVSTASDYRTVDGVKVAFQVVNSNALQSVTLKLTTVEHNVALDDAMFGGL